ncbi:MAG TPA: peptide-methionine (R)-S-oxide reductase MsrB [Rhizomicrobium sp.]
MTDKKTDRDWQAALTPAQYRVLRQAGTEPPGSSPLNHEKRAGEFLCAGCGATLYDSTAKYESGSGWPSFYKAKDGAVAIRTDASHGMVREEAVCAGCGGHLGHVFPDGPEPTGLRYCMNGAALKFEPKS